MIDRKIIASLMSLVLAIVFFSCRKKNQVAPNVAKIISIHKQIVDIQEKMNGLEDEAERENLEIKLASCQDEYDILRENFTEVEQKQFEEELSKLGK